MLPLLVLALHLSAGSASAATALDDAAKIQDVSTAFMAITMTPDISDYLSDPKTVCTVFPPDNAGLEKSMEQLGPHVGQLTMNETMSRLIFDYAVIPGKAMKLSEFKDGKIMTRAKEPLYVLNYQGKTYIFSNPDHPVLVKKSNIKAGKCLVHIVGETVPPPSTLEQMDAWYKEYVQAHPEKAVARKPSPELLAATTAIYAKYGPDAGRVANVTATAANKTAGAAAGGATATGGDEKGAGTPGLALPTGGAPAGSAPPASPAPSSGRTAAAVPATVMGVTAVAVLIGMLL